MDNTRMWRANSVYGLEMLKAAHKRHVYPRHLHDTYVIEVVEDGVDEFYCSGHTYTAAAGSIVLINPLEVHTGRSIGRSPLRYRSMYPDIAFMQHLAAECGLAQAPVFSDHVVQDAHLAQVLLQMHVDMEKNETGLSGLQSRLARCLTELIGRYADKTRRSRPRQSCKTGVLHARQYIARRFNEHISLEHLAALSGLSPFHFLRLFRQEVGLPPHQYLTCVRIQHAKSMLLQGTAIAQVAYETGFCDQSHLSRHFKRMIGVTPGEYAA